MLCLPGDITTCVSVYWRNVRIHALAENVLPGVHGPGVFLTIFIILGVIGGAYMAYRNIMAALEPEKSANSEITEVKEVLETSKNSENSGNNDNDDYRNQ